MVTNTIDIIVTMETPACKHSPGLDHNASKYTVNPTGGQRPVYTAVPHSLPSYKVSSYLRSSLLYLTGKTIFLFILLSEQFPSKILLPSSSGLQLVLTVISNSAEEYIGQPLHLRLDKRNKLNCMPSVNE